MSDWATIADLATAAGTLVLAVATFSSVRSANRAARVAERTLLVGLRPLLVPSRLEDPPEKVNFGDGHWVTIEGGHAALEPTDEAIYLTMSIRNAGSGLAVLQAWHLAAERTTAREHADLDRFRRLNRDIYVPAGDIGFWQGALRDPAAPEFAETRKALDAGDPVTIELLYGDHEGGQRMISRFALTAVDGTKRITSVSRHWDLDRQGPRS